MQFLGYVLLVLAFAASVYGYRARERAKRMLAAPFRRTGEIAANGWVRGDVTCEGNLRAPTPAFAPCSGEPCLYYEVEIIHHWTRFVKTDNGAMREEHGTTRLDTCRSGVVFYVDDGTGPVAVDASAGIDAELEKTFEVAHEMGWGDFNVGRFQVSVPDPGADRLGRSVQVIERVLPATGSMFLLGEVDPRRALTKLVGSRQGRIEVIRATKQRAFAGLVASAVLFCPAFSLAAFTGGEPEDLEAALSCQVQDETPEMQPCTGKIRGDYGSDVTLTVSQAGTFIVTAAPAHPTKNAASNPLVPLLDIHDAAGRTVVANLSTSAQVELPPGTYAVNVRDLVAGSARRVKGGLGYELAVKRIALAVPPPIALAPLPAVEESVAFEPVAPEPVVRASPAPRPRRKSARR